MHLAHRIDPGGVGRRSKLDLIEGHFLCYRSERHHSELPHQDASGGGRLGDGLGGEQLAGGCERGDSCRNVDRRSKEIACSADDRPMVQPGASERQSRLLTAVLQQRSKYLDRRVRFRKCSIASSPIHLIGGS